nr:EOG090X0JX7 [Ilyocryptus agilis]
MQSLVRLSTVCRPVVFRPVRLGDKTATLYSLKRFSTKNPFLVDTNVAKDVVLYTNNNVKFHKYLNIFAITQLGFWLYLAEFSMSTLRDIPVQKTEPSDENLAWYRRINLGENKYRRGIFTLCLSVGFLLLGGSWMYSLKAVKNIVLRKGGNNVTFITHAPFNRIRYIDVPLKNVSAAQSRNAAKVQLPIKVKGYMGYFVVDVKGEFRNPSLFDATVGLKRILK